MSDQPNILMIVADQWRFDYLGAAGCDWLRTPNLDALAARGALVSHCCTTSPVCVPARIGLATGQYPERFGSADNHSFLPGRATTFYQRLRDANYYTGVVGKLDLAKPQPYNGITGQRPSLFSLGGSLIRSRPRVKCTLAVRQRSLAHTPLTLTKRVSSMSSTKTTRSVKVWLVPC